MRLTPGFTAHLSLPKSAELYEAKSHQADLSLVTPQRITRSLGVIYCGGRGGCVFCNKFGCHRMTAWFT